MNQELVDKLQAAQQILEPQFKNLRSATSALKRALKLAGEDKLDALPMYKALGKLEQATVSVPDETLQEATESFRAATENALGALAFDFAKGLRELFAQRGLEIGGRPPTLSVGELVLQIDVAARKPQWFYGKEALTRKLPMSSAAIIKAYEQQNKVIVERDTNPESFFQELFRTWDEELQSRSRRPSEGVSTWSRPTAS